MIQISRKTFLTKVFMYKCRMIEKYKPYSTLSIVISQEIMNLDVNYIFDYCEYILLKTRTMMAHPFTIKPSQSFGIPLARYHITMITNFFKYRFNKHLS